jgi:serine/threonine protein kinase
VLCIVLSVCVCVILCFLCIVVPLPPGANPFAVSNNNNNNNNNNNVLQICDVHGNIKTTTNKWATTAPAIQSSYVFVLYGGAAAEYLSLLHYTYIRVGLSLHFLFISSAQQEIIYSTCLNSMNLIYTRRRSSKQTLGISPGFISETVCLRGGTNGIIPKTSLNYRPLMAYKLNSFWKRPNLGIRTFSHYSASSELDCIIRRECNLNPTGVYWFCDRMQHILPQCSTIKIWSTSNQSSFIHIYVYADGQVKYVLCMHF